METLIDRDTQACSSFDQSDFSFQEEIKCKEEDNWFEIEFDEEEDEEEEEDNGWNPPTFMSSEIERRVLVDYYGLIIRSEPELMMFEEEEYNAFIPAAKSCIKELKMVEVEEVTQCSICFEDVNVGVPLPCSHVFHMNCIQDWLMIGHSCPLCRFQLPTG